MKIKFEKKVAPTVKQFEELSHFISKSIEQNEKEPKELTHSQYFDVSARGAFGTYTYRVNLSYQLITVKEVK